MFRSQHFYRIVSIQRDKEYHGTSFWDAGYKYSYTPTSYAMRYIAKIAEKYTDRNLKSKCLEYAVVKSVNEEELVIKIIGRQKDIDKLLTELCTTDTEFTKRFSMKAIPKAYV
jgi:hypothetical protein